jgi:transposase InsO family protein
VLEPGIGFSGERVAKLLDRAAKGRLPEVITADNGSEFTSKVLDAWAFEQGLKLHFTTPGQTHGKWLRRVLPGPLPRRVSKHRDLC